MSILGKILGTGAKETIIGLGDVADRLFTSKDEKLSHEEVRMRINQNPALKQIELNIQEAKHRTIFVAGWRPFIGWVCGVALLYNFILRDIMGWVSRIIEPIVYNSEGLLISGIEPPPALAMEHLMTVLMGMLGLGAMRTYEKIKDKTK